MTFGGKHPIFWLVQAATLGLLLMTAVHLSAQQPPAAQPPIVTENLFRNIQVLKGIPIDTFFDVMGMFASSMGEDCTFCHSKDAVFRHEAFGDETPRIRQALGGTAELAKISSSVARGTYSGFDTDHKELPVEIFAKAPNQRTWIIHMPDGDSHRVFDGRNGWWAGPDGPAPLETLTTGNLDRYRLEALVAFPAGLKQAFSGWKVGRTAIDDRPVQIVQGTNAGLLPVNLYFDTRSGLLVRLVRWNATPV